MDDLTVGIKQLHVDARMPQYAHSDDSGADLYSCLPDGIMVVGAGGWKLVPTGIAVELPVGYEAQVRSRSGLALKEGLFCLNGVGTIDTSYRGEICVILANFSNNDYYLDHHVRIAQMVISPVRQAVFQSVAYLSETARNAAGFGSSGLK
jgi:dUTP pyrophosphatase